MKPLAGTRILTIENFGAAPYGSMFLADLGADVIKIEDAATGGDSSRHVGPHLLGSADSQYFQAFNLNKRSVTLNLKSKDDYRAFLHLVAGADAVMNNLRGNLPEKLGLDYTSLKDHNAAIVCLHISAYGRNNSRKSWPGYDYLMQAEAGLMSVTGEPDGPPSRMGVSVIDYMSGVIGVVGLLSCIIQARATGKGCDVDTSLFDVALHQLSYLGVWFLNAGDVPSRIPRSAHPSLVPVQTARTADGWIYLMCMKDSFWEGLADRIGCSDMKSDPRFHSQEARRQNRDALSQLLDERLSTRTTAEWLERLSGVLPVAPIQNVASALSSEFITEIKAINTIQHSVNAALKVFANPIKLNGERLEQQAAPALGHDNVAVLGEHRSSAETSRDGQ